MPIYNAKNMPPFKTSRKNGPAAAPNEATGAMRRNGNQHRNAAINAENAYLQVADNMVEKRRPIG